MPETIAFQGEKGAYSEQAIFRHFGRDDCTPIPCKDLRATFECVAGNEADQGVIPVENTQAGSINKTYDLLLDYDLSITGEVFLPIHHCFLALPETDLQDVTTVYSHPQALAQCEEFLEELNVDPHPTYDTAGGARKVRESGSENTAAIASKVAAKEHELQILKEGIETRTNNTTRFLVISTEPSGVRENCKTSLVFETRDIPAALYKCLGGFATNGVNLTKLESRPLPDVNWKYMFYLDLEGHRDDDPVQQALEELEYFTVSCEIISSYPKGQREPSH